jgi:hypothetical protein
LISYRYLDEKRLPTLKKFDVKAKEPSKKTATDQPGWAAQAA